MKKIIVSIIVSITILIQLSITVFADYATLEDWGFGYCYQPSTVGSTINLYPVDGAGGQVNSQATGLYVYWELVDFNPDYTYTFTFSCSASAVNPVYNSDIKIVVNNYSSNIRTTPINNYSQLTTVNNTVYTNVTVKNKKNITFTCKVNPSLSKIEGIPLYVYTYANINPLEYTNAHYTTNGWSVACEYDPGGANLQNEILEQIYNYGSANSVPNGTNLDNSLNNLTNSEDAVNNKSNDLMNNVSSEMTDNLNQAKELSTKLKPAAIQINNIYNSFMSVLPTEVKAIFIAIPLLLFVGWLVGRIRE